MPFIIPLYLLVLLFNGYPLFFVQDRVGKNRESFTIYKLRTMKVNKITPVGRLIRKFGLDETPQLINILKGDMFFIGPRPLTKSDIARLGWDTSEFDIRWTVPPGLTGLSQLSPICSKENTWMLDNQYCKNRSIKLDFTIICKTIITIFKGKTEVR